MGAQIGNFKGLSKLNLRVAEMFHVRMGIKAFLGHLNTTENAWKGTQMKIII